MFRLARQEPGFCAGCRLTRPARRRAPTRPWLYRRPQSGTQPQSNSRTTRRRRRYHQRSSGAGGPGPAAARAAAATSSKGRSSPDLRRRRGGIRHLGRHGRARRHPAAGGTPRLRPQSATCRPAALLLELSSCPSLRVFGTPRHPAREQAAAAGRAALIYAAAEVAAWRRPRSTGDGRTPARLVGSVFSTSSSRLGADATRRRSSLLGKMSAGRELARRSAPPPPPPTPRWRRGPQLPRPSRRRAAAARAASAASAAARRFVGAVQRAGGACTRERGGGREGLRLGDRLRRQRPLRSLVQLRSDAARAAAAAAVLLLTSAALAR